MDAYSWFESRNEKAMTLGNTASLRDPVRRPTSSTNCNAKLQFEGREASRSLEQF